MQDAGEGPLGVLFAEDPGRVGIRLTGMDDQRQIGFAGGGDVGAEAPLLRCARTVLVVVVEPGFAEPDNLRVLGHADQVLGGDLLRLAGRLVGMDADGAPADVIETFRKRQHPIEARDVGADGQHHVDARFARPVNDAVEVVGKLGKIEMAVAVDQHRDQPPPPAPRRPSLRLHP